MTEQSDRTSDRSCEQAPDDEIATIDYVRVIWRRRGMIGGIALAAVLATIIVSLFMTNFYQARAVIMPVAARDSGAGSTGMAILAQQFGGLPGIAMPSSASAAEIVSLLKSNILREKIIKQYNLLPLLFPERWDAKQQTWKRGGDEFSLRHYLALFEKGFRPAPLRKAREQDPDIPDTWDALRLFNDIITIAQDGKQNTITISATFPDAETASRILDHFLVTLTDYMSSEAKRVAATNRKYLEAQLGSTADPFIKQKTYGMIAQQIEAGMMAEVKENFAFKVIDPPLAPDKISKPKRAQMAVLSLIIGLGVGIFAAFFREYLVRTGTGR